MTRHVNVKDVTLLWNEMRRHVNVKDVTLLWNEMRRHGNVKDVMLIWNVKNIYFMHMMEHILFGFLYFWTIEVETRTLKGFLTLTKCYQYMETCTMDICIFLSSGYLVNNYIWPEDYLNKIRAQSNGKMHVLSYITLKPLIMSRKKVYTWLQVNWLLLIMYNKITPYNWKIIKYRRFGIKFRREFGNIWIKPIMKHVNLNRQRYGLAIRILQCFM